MIICLSHSHHCGFGEALCQKVIIIAADFSSNPLQHQHAIDSHFLVDPLAFSTLKRPFAAFRPSQSISLTAAQFARSITRGVNTLVVYHNRMQNSHVNFLPQSSNPTRYSTNPTARYLATRSHHRTHARHEGAAKWRNSLLFGAPSPPSRTEPGGSRPSGGHNSRRFPKRPSHHHLSVPTCPAPYAKPNAPMQCRQTLRVGA
jgi:hypothetical protein